MKDNPQIIQTPISGNAIESLRVGDMILLSGYIYTGRDAVLPKLKELFETGTLEENGIDLQGSVIFHTAVSPAGVGPTSSNKLEIEGNIPILSKAGVKLHLGKGALKPETVAELNRYGSAYAVIPPVTALLESKTLNRKVVAFPELGMEALHSIEVVEYPVIIAAVNGETIY
ncbi:MAG: fumarate hydratase C-terminal domain-containing protein [Clostridiales Family XIII bacterium]|jgi:fumarate hydratase subunit beta|nr:fumarate hydratase C-terminal domain-containing protein [Clostridiales Family XIII bacterium]